jgi:hypothetical protein
MATGDYLVEEIKYIVLKKNININKIIKDFNPW